MRLFLLLLPWLELFTLIQLGVATSALAALAYVFLTFVAGLALLRLQGRDLFNRLREAQEGRLFGPQIFVDDMAVGLAALLLMVPGLITDTLALLVLMPRGEGSVEVSLGIVGRRRVQAGCTHHQARENRQHSPTRGIRVAIRVSRLKRVAEVFRNVSRTNHD